MTGIEGIRAGRNQFTAMARGMAGFKQEEFLDQADWDLTCLTDCSINFLRVFTSISDSELR